MSTPPPLTRHQMALLTVASRLHTWSVTEAPVRIYEAFGLEPLTFRRRLAAVLQLPAAEAFDPITVRSLRAGAEKRTRRVRPEAGR